ncbi:glycosyltransferase family 9 protein [Teredinibacter sp. KSP-S5-2]|uniref:glycosyltransferase family 9 protein n=1 Tax=Teredinibacter sp. KSP-S5-2 TaxID=3034506 RepID=UPI002934F478|nr:glycosyltransferase family 9 protein [Teredinibacter sp. KSP-S5-2]WNO08124.1 glycosyltransferase family 9 protein [Teredinibacter sp. KSP-S5-2]
MASPVASVIKKKSPETQVVWITQAECADLLKENPHIDEVIVWDKKQWRTLWRKKQFFQLWQEIKRFREKLQNYQFDVAIDLQGLFKSGFIARLSGAKQRIGLGSKEGSYWLMTKTVSRDLGDQSLIGSEYRYLLNQLGYDDSIWEMYVHSTKPKLDDTTLEEGDDYLAICPFTTRPQKHWINDHWVQLCLRIRGRYQLKTVILGGPGDGEKAEEIARSCGAINMAGKTSLAEASYLIKNAKLVIGVDTGLTHMGHAHKVPTIALFGSTCPYNFVGNETSKVIYLEKDCSPCRRNPSCDQRFDCMREISPDRVLAEIKPLMKSHYENTSP